MYVSLPLAIVIKSTKKELTFFDEVFGDYTEEL